MLNVETHCPHGRMTRCGEEREEQEPSPPGCVTPSGQIGVRCLSHRASDLLVLPCPHPLRVARDGVAAAGMATLANELEEVLTPRRRPVVMHA